MKALRSLAKVPDRRLDKKTKGGASPVNGRLLYDEKPNYRRRRGYMKQQLNAAVAGRTNVGEVALFQEMAATALHMKKVRTMRSFIGTM